MGRRVLAWLLAALLAAPTGAARRRADAPDGTAREGAAARRSAGLSGAKRAHEGGATTPRAQIARKVSVEEDDLRDAGAAVLPPRRETRRVTWAADVRSPAPEAPRATEQRAREPPAKASRRRAPPKRGRAPSTAAGRCLAHATARLLGRVDRILLLAGQPPQNRSRAAQELQREEDERHPTLGPCEGLVSRGGAAGGECSGDMTRLALRCVPVCFSALRDTRLPDLVPATAPEFLGLMTKAALALADFAPSATERLLSTGALREGLPSEACRQFDTRYCFAVARHRDATSQQRVAAAATLMGIYGSTGCAAMPEAATRVAHHCDLIRDTVFTVCLLHGELLQPCNDWIATFPGGHQPQPVAAAFAGEPEEVGEVDIPLLMDVALISTEEGQAEIERAGRELLQGVAAMRATAAAARLPTSPEPLVVAELPTLLEPHVIDSAEGRAAIERASRIMLGV